MSTFFVKARYVLLTYAQSGDLSEWTVLDHIGSLGAECIIGREDHVDEGTHLHVFVDFGRKFQSRRQDIFDVAGRHPNIVPSRGRPEFGWDYAVKDGNVVAGGLGRPGSGGLPAAENKWSQIVGAEDREEFLRLVRELDPKSFVLRHQEILGYADRYYAEDREPYVGPDDVMFDLGMVPDLAGWREQSLGDDTLKADVTDHTARGRVDLIYEDIAWLEANCVFVELKEPIFRASTE
uniref:Replication-associated protein n=1 Tax=Emberiza rustica Genomoviridae sp. TaxID=2814949 RepID=A0A8E7L5X3_9VIRU